MSAYEEYVSENYMYVPKDGLDRMKEHVNGRIQAFTGANGYYPTLIEVTDMIREDLSSCSYSLNLGPLPSDVDYTENFFFDQKEGFCTLNQAGLRPVLCCLRVKIDAFLQKYRTMTGEQLSAHRYGRFRKM